MEGRVYYCGWKRSDQGFELWILSNKRVKGRGLTFSAAEESLVHQVMRVYGDGEPVLEYVPGRPDNASSADATPQYLVIFGNDNYRGFVGDGRARLFTGPTCEECGAPSGERTTEPLKVEELDARADGITVFWDNNRSNTMISGVLRYAFSEKFLSLLTDQERSNFEWREVKVYRRARLRFYEMISAATVSFVPKAGIQFWSWSCPRCSYFSGLSSPGHLNLPRFVSQNEVGEGPPSFAAGERESPHLCLTHARWNELIRNGEVKGLASSPVAVIPSEQVSSPEVYPLPVYERLSEMEDRLWRQYRTNYSARNTPNARGLKHFGE